MRQQLTLDPLPHTVVVGRRAYPVLRVLSPNGRANPWVRRAAREAILTAVAVTVCQMEPRLARLIPPVVAQPIWTLPEQRVRDGDNLSGSGVLKACLDALVRLGILPDDRHEYLTVLPPIIQVEPGVRRLVIELEAEG